jgi:hypothetical protein
LGLRSRWSISSTFLPHVVAAALNDDEATPGAADVTEVGGDGGIDYSSTAGHSSAVMRAEFKAIFHEWPSFVVITVVPRLARASQVHILGHR